MDPPSSSQIATEIKPIGWSLEELLRGALAAYLRNFLALTIPVLIVFAALFALDIALTFLLGATSGTTHTAIYWIKNGVILLACMVGSGVAAGANGFSVLRDLEGHPVSLGGVLAEVRRKICPLSTAAVMFNLVVLVPAAPGILMFVWAMDFSANQRILPAMGCVMAAALLLFYPLILFMQTILFAFTVTEEGKSGWSAVMRSRSLIRRAGAGGLTGNSLFRVFVLLHVSLMPALVVIFLSLIPIIMLFVVYPLEQLLEDVQGHHISLPYLIVQAVNAAVMTLIVPMFVAPLAVLYRDIRSRYG